MKTVLLAAGTLLHIQGIPITLKGPAPVASNSSNFSLIEGLTDMLVKDANPGDVSALPLYQCHKQVRAMQIARFDLDLTVNPAIHYIVPVDPELSPVPVDLQWMEKNNPDPGGYLVEYADGYKSYSPAKAFEEGYTRI